ncbi:putative ankyrin repeat-containing domain-containing protein [Helianthus annuus]|nr:putative ankyrin repeat-containing domain-containing protein [Helianthus annuus]KAJ0853695.1 putative ankyrin repeat-containing domain-containing protein [Helianthus annuus]
MMSKDDLELQNQNHDTAFCQAAATRNIKTVMIMLEKNRNLATIAGVKGKMMPLYAAAMNKNYEVVKYLYECSNDLHDDGWTTQKRGWLLKKCVEGDMFDVALRIVKIYPRLESGEVLKLLALKPEAFSETKSNKIKRNINSGKHEFSLMIVVPLQVTK